MCRRCQFEIITGWGKVAETDKLEAVGHKDPSMGTIKPYEICPDCDHVEVEEVDVQFERAVPTELNFDRVRTGRFSSAGPNLSNKPRGDDECDDEDS